MGSSNIYTAGLNNVGSYQVSGAPFVTSSAVPASGTVFHKIEFPFVTKEITILNHAPTTKPIRLSFSERGMRDDLKNYVLIGSSVDGGPTTLNVKATELYMMSDDSTATYEVSVFASLTNLPISRVNNIGPSGNNWSGSSGVG
jgi:hypothetical protein